MVYRESEDVSGVLKDFKRLYWSVLSVFGGSPAYYEGPGGFKGFSVAFQVVSGEL